MADVTATFTNHADAGVLRDFVSDKLAAQAKRSDPLHPQAVLRVLRKLVSTARESTLVLSLESHNVHPSQWGGIFIGNELFTSADIRQILLDLYIMEGIEYSEIEAIEKYFPQFTQSPSSAPVSLSVMPRL